MKILYHHRVGSKDGQYVHIEELINAFEELGHEVVVAGPKFVNVEKYGDESRFIKLFKRVIPAFVYEYIEFTYSLIDYFNLKKIIKTYKPDLIYERYNLFFISGILIKKRYNLPLLLEVNSPLREERAEYGNLRNKRLAKLVENYTWKNADHIFCVTDVLAGKIKEAGVKEACITVTPNGINRDKFRLEQEDSYYKEKQGLEGKVVLGFVGFVREWHGLNRVLNLLNKTHNKNIHLLIVGDGPACKGLLSTAKQSNIHDQVTITGVVPRDKIKNYIAAFDIALQPNVVEYASPLKLFEYMVLGKAIIAPDQDNIREILTDNKDSLLFHAQDENGFQDAIQKLLPDSATRSRLGEAAKNTIHEKNLTWVDNAKVVIDTYNNFI